MLSEPCSAGTQDQSTRGRTSFAYLYYHSYFVFEAQCCCCARAALLSSLCPSLALLLLLASFSSRLDLLTEPTDRTDRHHFLGTHLHAPYSYTLTYRGTVLLNKTGCGKCLPSSLADLLPPVLLHCTSSPPRRPLPHTTSVSCNRALASASCSCSNRRSPL